MVEKIKPTDEVFQQAVQRGDRAKLEEWDREGLIEWHEKNYIGQELSRQKQAERQAQEQLKGLQASQSDFYGEKNLPEEPEQYRSPRLDAMGVKPNERLWSGHPLVQRAVRSGDGVLLGEIYRDVRYDTIRGSAPYGAFTRGDIENHFRDAS
jgi:hypothetical protein